MISRTIQLTAKKSKTKAKKKVVFFQHELHFQITVSVWAQILFFSLLFEHHQKM